MPDLPFRAAVIARAIAVVVMPLAVAACVAPTAPTPPPPPAVIPVPTPTSAPRTTDWRDIPLTPGDWRYDPSGPVARFGTGGAAELVVRCDRASRTVTLARTGVGGVSVTMAITTSAGDRALAAVPQGQPSPALVASFPARDGFLDRMAFSRGRFIIAVTGTPRLVIPAWPEFARVIEDCRS